MPYSRYASLSRAARQSELVEDWAQASVLWRQAGQAAHSEVERLFCLVRSSHARLLAEVKQYGPVEEDQGPESPENT